MEAVVAVKLAMFIKPLELPLVTLELFEPEEVIKGVVEQISYPIQTNEAVGSDTQYAIITVRGTRQGTIEEVTSIHTPGIASWGIMRFGA